MLATDVRFWARRLWRRFEACDGQHFVADPVASGRVAAHRNFARCALHNCRPPWVMFEWDDLRIFTVTARSGSFAVAGARLGMDPTTVGRRIQRLENVLKATLLVRSPRGLLLTAAGARLQAVGAQVELAVDQVGDTESRLGGNVRISASEGFGTHILAPELARLQRQRPDLSIELAANQAFLSPSKREVDIAITLTPSQSRRLFVEGLTDYELGLYGASAYLDEAGRPDTKGSLLRHSFIGYIEDMIYAAELHYLAEVHPELRPRLTSSSIRAQLEFVRAGAGLAILPCFLAASVTGIERVLPDEIALVRTFWVSTHHEIKNTARIRLVRERLAKLVTDLRPILLPTGLAAPGKAPDGEGNPGVTPPPSPRAAPATAPEARGPANGPPGPPPRRPPRAGRRSPRPAGGSSREGP
jgi:DNA-binding transcriptional LysR family regulator